jgi:SPP1 gp7 family putative phage head morphogenesis protein
MATVAYEVQFLSDLLGRLEVATKYEGVAFADWAALPFRQAIEQFLKRKLMSRAAFDKLSDAYKQRAFTVGEGYKRFAIEQTKKELDAALRDGVTQGEFKRNLRAFFDANGLTKDSEHHLFTVYQTNVLGSYQHGRYQQLTTPAMLHARPMWRYITAGDSRVRPTHQEMSGRIYPADSEVWASWFPPCGFNCRCSVEALAQDEADELGGTSGSPDVEPDEGFAGSPQSWLMGD